MSEKLAMKVAAISDNAGDFGHHGHLLVTRDGRIYEAGRHRCPPNPLLKVGDVLQFSVNSVDEPCNWYEHYFEAAHPFRTGKVPEEVRRELWPDESPQAENHTKNPSDQT